MANPRIDDLRRKLDKEPGSRLFAQLAEELRKEGQLDEAIRVARTGLDKHPAYPSARMTLGRALLDNGELAAARREFDAVLKGAPDNILASRYLAECLEGLGQHAEALVRYRATLSMAPGDRQIIGHIEALERRAAVPAAAGASMPAVGAQGALRGLSTQMEKAAGQATDPTAGAEEVFEVEPEIEPDPVSASDAPIPLVSVDDDEFELERPLDARAALAAAEPTPVEPPAAAPPAPADVPFVYAREVIFEPEPEPQPEPPAPPMEAAPPPRPPQEHTLEARRPDLGLRPPELGPPAAEVGPEPTALEEALPEAEVLDEEFDMEPPPSGPMQMTFRALVDEVPSAGPRAPSAGEPELASPTLAELYFDQGFLDKAAEVYRRLLGRDPGQERWRSRLTEIESVQRLHARAQTPSPPARLPEGRRAAVERAIARLEDLRAALARRN